MPWKAVWQFPKKTQNPSTVSNMTQDLKSLLPSSAILGFFLCTCPRDLQSSPRSWCIQLACNCVQDTCIHSGVKSLRRPCI